MYSELMYCDKLNSRASMLHQTRINPWKPKDENQKNTNLVSDLYLLLNLETVAN